MFKVLADFADLKDKNFKYHAGDVFPRQGYNPSAGRIAELASKRNKRGYAVIAEVKEDPVEQVEQADPIEQAEELVDAEEPVEEKPVKQRGRRRNA
jgi:hypothetical protein